MIKRGLGVKNFFVRGESVKYKEKGLFNLLNYLENEQHSNHNEKTEKIVPIHSNREKFYLNTLEKVKKREFDTKKQGKRGRELGSYRFSYCFSFPTDIKPNEKEIKSILNILLKDFSRAAGIDPGELLENCFINIHYNKNIHINLVVNKVINNQVIDLSKRKYLTILKKSFNYRNLKVLGLDNNTYKRKREERETKVSNIYLDKLKKSLKEEIKEEYNIKQKEIDKLVKRFFTYLDRYENHKNQNNRTELIKLDKYIKDTIEKVKVEEIKKEMKDYSSNLGLEF